MRLGGMELWDQRVYMFITSGGAKRFSKVAVQFCISFF